MAVMKYGKMLQQVYTAADIPYQLPEKGCDVPI